MENMVKIVLKFRKYQLNVQIYSFFMKKDHLVEYFLQVQECIISTAHFTVK